MTRDTKTHLTSEISQHSTGDEAFLVVQSADRSQVVPLREGIPVTIGRSRSCTIFVDDERVSRRHARIERLGGEIVVTDLDSRNGTRVGGQKIDGKRTVEGGDMVSVGPLVAVVAVTTGKPGRDKSEEPDERFIIADAQMAAVYERCRRVAATPISVLVVGETGVGKENVAETIHRLSPRSDRPFLRLHLTALPEGLLEGELFGHEKGAFTGADKRRAGYFESASGGTLFLDEIGELPLATQAKLLRVIETGRIVRLGSTEEIVTDVRIVAATNRDLAAEVRAGRFREDAYFRLCAFRIDVPPLRERRIEVPLLASLFVREAARRMSLPVPALKPDLLTALGDYGWPGNVRELKHVMEAAVVMAAPGDLGIEHLPQTVRMAATSRESPAVRDDNPMKETMKETVGPLDAAERGAIVAALAACQGNQTHAAAKLGISRRALIYKMQKHNIRTIKDVG